MTDPGVSHAPPVPPSPIPGIDVDKVSAWFAANIPGCELPLSFELISGGRSNLTYRANDAAGHHYVLRRPPMGHLLPTAHDMAREFRLIDALGPQGVPVAPALGLCRDEAVNGTPFYVMGFVDGHILRTPAEVEAAISVDVRRRASEALVDVLTDIHAVDLDKAGLADLSRKEGYVARQLKRWDGQYRAARDDQGGPTIPDLEATHDILTERIPDQGPATIVHGDYRLDNTVIGDDGSVRAVLDWELCTLGDPLADVGLLLAYWALPGDDGAALEYAPTEAPGFFTREEIIDRYAERSGRDLSEIDFYVAFSFWRVGCIIEGVYTRYLRGAMGDDGASASSFRRSIDWLGAKALERAQALAN